MFEVGDILRAKMDIAEQVYEGCKGTSVYKKMMYLAETKRYEVIGVVGSAYVLRHLKTDPLVEAQHDKNEVHTYFELDKELTNNNKQEEER